MIELLALIRSFRALLCDARYLHSGDVGAVLARLLCENGSCASAPFPSPVGDAPRWRSLSAGLTERLTANGYAECVRQKNIYARGLLKCELCHNRMVKIFST
jgi:hypothetical protein